MGGSYVVIQKYLHDLSAWTKVPTPLQEEIIGRTKVDNSKSMMPMRRVNRTSRWRPSSTPLVMSMISCGTTCRLVVRDTGIWYLFHRLFSVSLGYREDAATHVYWRPAGCLRPAAGFLDARTGATFFAPANSALEALVQAAQEKLPRLKRLNARSSASNPFRTSVYGGPKRTSSRSCSCPLFDLKQTSQGLRS